MTDDELVEGIRARIAANDHLSRHLARPGTGQPDGLQMYVGGRRAYFRGTPELAAARAAGELEPLPIPVPVPDVELAAREQQLGAAIPPFLRRLYREIGDGGFGPWYGLLPLGQLRWFDPSSSLDGPPPLEMPARLLRLTDEGCGIASLIDASDEGAPLWVFDPNRDADGEMERGAQDLRELLADWLSDRGRFARAARTP